MTPVLVAISSNLSTISLPGDTLTLRGHGLSTSVADNLVTVGGEPCAVTGAALDASYSAPVTLTLALTLTLTVTVTAEP